MHDLRGKVAVVTGGASGIGLAMARAFVGEGMATVIADVEGPALDEAVAGFAGAGVPVSGVRTDVSDLSSVEELADWVYERHGACHVLCNNAGVGAPSAKVWSTTPNDWRWVFGVNVTGVVNGILAFVPRMIDGGEPGHIVNTSSTDGPVQPLPSASVYAASKAAVSTLTECLASQLEEDGTPLRASVFYPTGGLLRTGLWTADRNRPAARARERPRETPPMTPEKLEEMAKGSGHELKWQDLDALGRLVVEGIRDERFVIMIDPEAAARTLHARADATGRGRRPAPLELGH
jgi:NAD(P)-dependent dehydrogenase (short-subunit alcohol dehydrogenase family)